MRSPIAAAGIAAALGVRAALSAAQSAPPAPVFSYDQYPPDERVAFTGCA